jgi:hypothetical protein
VNLGVRYQLENDVPFEPTILRWLIGGLVALFIGHFAVEYFDDRLRKHISLPSKEADTSGEKRVTPALTGTLERLFFLILIGYQVPGGAAAMIGWLGLKLATNWNHPDWKDSPRARTRAFVALLTGLVSMLYALLGGLIASGVASVGI